MYAVRTRLYISAGYLENKQPTYDKPFKVWWLLLVPPSLTLKSSAFCPQSVFRTILRIAGIVSLNSISRLVFVMKTRCFFCDVGSEFLSR
jgi:hypothetical protein